MQLILVEKWLATTEGTGDGPNNSSRYLVMYNEDANPYLLNCSVFLPPNMQILIITPTCQSLLIQLYPLLHTKF